MNVDILREEQSRSNQVFMQDQVMKKRGQAEATSQIKKGRNSLFVVAAIAFLSGIYYYFKLEDSSILIVNAILSLCYFVFGFLVTKETLGSIDFGIIGLSNHTCFKWPT